MKLVMDEKLKHRLVGIFVILSLGAIFLPAMMKKSSQRLENNFSVKVQFPPKPKEPNVAVKDEKQMFKTIKIAKPGLQALSQSDTLTAQDKNIISSATVNEPVEVVVAKVSSNSQPIEKPVQLALNNASQNGLKKEAKKVTTIPERSVKAVVKAAKINVTLSKTPKPSKFDKLKVPTTKINRVAATKKDIYVVQLASFSELSYAQALVHKLHDKGYKANYIRIAGRKGVFYKVYAGYSPFRHDAVKLKMQLASTMQLNGFIVNTGVS